MDIRPAQANDAPLLWTFLALAAHESSVATVAALPGVAKYLTGWPRAGDFGVIAEIDGKPVGAAWARQFAPEDGPYVYVDAETPEIALGVHPVHQGQGIGSALLTALIAEAQAQGVGLCLNVRDGNPAVRLYERAGFVRLPGSERVNRTGGLSFGMTLGRAGWRRMTPADLPEVLTVADVVHQDFPERPEVFAEKQALFPEGCFLAVAATGQTLAYAITHPARLGRPAALDTLMASLPPDADCLYIHDVALLPEARGLGLGEALMVRLKDVAARHGLTRMALVAVYDAARYWRRHGFLPYVGDDTLRAKMAGYGEGAAYMVA